MEKEEKKEGVVELVEGFSKVCNGKATINECLLAAFAFIAGLYDDSPLTMDEIREHASYSLEKIYPAIAASRECNKNNVK